VGRAVREIMISSLPDTGGVRRMRLSANGLVKREAQR
jgi:hypothetical protein